MSFPVPFTYLGCDSNLRSQHTIKASSTNVIVFDSGIHKWQILSYGKLNFVIYFGHTFSIKIWALFYLILKILSNKEKFVKLNVENQLVMEKKRFCFALIVVRFSE